MYFNKIVSLFTIYQKNCRQLLTIENFSKSVIPPNVILNKPTISKQIYRQLQLQLNNVSSKAKCNEINYLHPQIFVK